MTDLQSRLYAQAVRRNVFVFNDNTPANLRHDLEIAQDLGEGLPLECWMGTVHHDGKRMWAWDYLSGAATGTGTFIECVVELSERAP